MTPKEKAMELAEKFPYTMKEAKDCALIVVEEILNITLFYFEDEEYWQQVKEEIENL